MSETISQLPLATQANATDLYPATQGSIGPNTGTSRAVTLTQMLASTLPLVGGTLTGGLTIAAGGITATGNSKVTGTLTSTAGVTVSSGGITATGNSALTGALTVSTAGTVGNQVTNFSQFAPLLNPAGYIHLPGGVTMQWGNGTGPTSAITMPYSFSGTPWSIICTLKDAAAGGAAIFVQTQSGTILPGSFTVLTVTAPSAGVAANFWWFAVGPT